MKFSERLREARTQKGVIQSDLAGKLGVTRTTIINWEKGVTTPDRSEVDKLSKILDIDLTTHWSQENQSGAQEENVDYGLVDKLMKAYQSTIDSKQQEIESKEKEILRLLDDKQWLRDHIDTLTKGRGFGARQEA